MSQIRDLKESSQEIYKLKKTLTIKTDKLFTIITPQISKFAKEWGKSGIVNIYTQHTTTSLRVLENELLHHADVLTWLDKNFPKDKPNDEKYLHDLISLRTDVPTEERINAYSHMRTLLFNTSETIPIENGKLMLGKWQDIHFIELDPGDTVFSLQDRKLICTFIEE